MKTKPKPPAKKTPAKKSAKPSPPPKKRGRPAITSPPSRLPEIAESMKQAAAIYKIPMAVLKSAKNAGCPAFRQQRVYRDALLTWLEANPQLVADGEAKGSEAELKREKLAVQIARLKHDLDVAKGRFMLKTESEEVWASCVAIVMEESKTLMDRDKYRVFIDRIKARLSQIIKDADPNIAIK